MAVSPISWGIRAVRVDGDWWRGPARTVDRDGLTWLEWADPDGPTEGYDWSVASSLPYDLAAIRHPADVLGFVRRWGFLHREDDEEAQPPTVEEFMEESLTMNWLLCLHGLLLPGHDAAETRRSLAQYWSAIITGEFGSRPTQAWLSEPRRRETAPEFIDAYAAHADVEAMKIDVRAILEEELGERLRHDVQLSISDTDPFMASEIEDARPPGEFMLELWPRDLLGCAYTELALLVTAGVPVAICPEDGRVFPVQDPRQIYCSRQCAGRARHRRFRERRRKTA